MTPSVLHLLTVCLVSADIIGASQILSFYLVFFLPASAYLTSVATEPLNLASAYQADLLARTAKFRPGGHWYAGYAGPWLENQFYDHWVAHSPQSQRIYVPIHWTDVLHKAPHLIPVVQKVIAPSIIYYMYLQFCRLKRHAWVAACEQYYDCEPAQPCHAW